MVVHADHPRRTDEQPGIAGSPARVCGARHRMPTDEAVLQTGGDDFIEDRALDAGDIGQRTVGSRFADVLEQGRQRGLGTARTISAPTSAARVSASVSSVVASKPSNRAACTPSTDRL